MYGFDGQVILVGSINVLNAINTQQYVVSFLIKKFLSA